MKALLRSLIAALLLVALILSTPGASAFPFAFWKTSAPTGDITTALLARWPMEEGSGTSVADATGNGHTGTVTGSGSSWNSSAAVGSSSIDFAGAAVDVTFTTVTTTGTTFTVAGWLWLASGTRTYEGIFWNTVTDHGLLVHNGKLDFYLGADNDANTVITTGSWHHCAVVVSAGAGTFYLDGAADGTFTTSEHFQTMEFGAEYSNTSSGRMDDLRLYDRALSTADIAALVALKNP